MKIEVGKTYLNGRGRRVRIIATDRREIDTPGPATIFPVVGLVDRGSHEDICVFTADGRYNLYNSTDEDLVQEASKYDHIKRGDVVHVVINDEPMLAHFYGADSNGVPFIYADQKSPWTTDATLTTTRVEHVTLFKALNLNLE